MEMPAHAKRGTVNLSHPSHSPLEDADAAGVSHITHRSGDGYMYVITLLPVGSVVLFFVLVNVLEPKGH